jgi:hypothetical protein
MASIVRTFVIATQADLGFGIPYQCSDGGIYTDSSHALGLLQRGDLNFYQFWYVATQNYRVPHVQEHYTVTNGDGSLQHKLGARQGIDRK